MNGLRSLLEQKKFLYIGEPATLDSIRMAEQSLNLVFADDYVDYLKEFGYVSYYGHELTGIVPDKLNMISVVKITEENLEIHPQVPRDFYVIEELHIDDMIVWQNQEGEIYLTRGLSEPILIGKSLLDYISGDDSTNNSTSEM